MLPLSLLPLAAVSPLAAGQAPSKAEALMDKIERSVALPAEAGPMQSYGRNYSFAEPDKVIATYLQPSPPSPPDESCEELLADFTTQPCSKEDVERMNSSERQRRATETPAGTRRWFANPDELPEVSDGG